MFEFTTDNQGNRRIEGTNRFTRGALGGISTALNLDAWNRAGQIREQEGFSRNYFRALAPGAGSVLSLGLGGPAVRGVSTLVRGRRVAPAVSAAANTSTVGSAAAGLGISGAIGGTAGLAQGGGVLGLPSMYGQADVDRNNRIRSQQANAARYQGQADYWAAQQRQNQFKAQQLQDQMVRDINNSFTPEQRRALQAMSPQMNTLNARMRAEAAYDEPDWLESMRGLSASDIEQFETAEGEARGKFADFLRRSGLGREGAIAEATQRERGERQSSVGRLGSTRASLARAGLLPSVESVAAEGEAARRAATVAQIRAERQSTLNRLTEGETTARADLERFLQNLSRQQKAARQDREAQWQAARSQDFQNWMRSQGF